MRIVLLAGGLGSIWLTTVLVRNAGVSRHRATLAFSAMLLPVSG